MTLSGTNVLSTALSFTLDGTFVSQFANVTTAGGDLLGVLTVTTDAAGADWSFDPALDVDNTGGDPSFNFVATVTDTDGDEATANHTVTVTDGADPTGGDTMTLSLDEDDLANGSDTTGPTMVSDTLSFTAGADAITSVKFSTDLSLLITDGDTLTASPVGDIAWVRVTDTQITGSVGGVVVVTLDLTPPTSSIAPGATDATTSVKMTLSGEFANQFGDDIATVLALGSVQVDAFDNDGDKATGTVTLSVTDDIPSDISPTPAIVINSGDAVGSSDLDFFGNIGADQPGSIVFNGINGGAVETDADPLLDKNGIAVLNENGDSIFLFGIGTGVLVGSTNSTFVIGTHDPLLPDPTVVFQITLNQDGAIEANDLYTIEFFQKLNDGGGFDFSGAGFTRAGNNLFTTTDGPDVGGISQDLLFSAFNSGGASSVNTNATDVSVANSGAGIDDGEGVRIDFVTDASATTGNGREFYDYGVQYNGNGFSFVIAALGNTGNTDIVLRVYDANEDDPVNTPFGNGAQRAAVEQNHLDALTDDAALQDTITEIKINNVALDLTPGSSTIIMGITYIVILDGSGDFVVQNIQLNDEVKVFTADGYNRIEIENYDDSDNGDGFSINSFGIETTQAGSNIDLSIDLLVADEDGDTATGSIDITVTPDGTTMTGTAAAETFIGGSGSDTMTGAGGADVFVVDLQSLTDAAVEELITDYSGVGGDGDAIDLSALLDLAIGTDLEGGAGQTYVSYDSGTGDLRVDQAGNADIGGGGVVANIGSGLANETIKILFDDGSGNSGSDLV